MIPCNYFNEKSIKKYLKNEDEFRNYLIEKLKYRGWISEKEVKMNGGFADILAFKEENKIIIEVKDLRGDNYSPKIIYGAIKQVQRYRKNNQIKHSFLALLVDFNKKNSESLDFLFGVLSHSNIGTIKFKNINNNIIICGFIHNNQVL